MLAFPEVMSQEKVSGAATLNATEGSMELAKQMAYKDAMNKFPKADLLINPLYQSTLSNNSWSIEVSGFPARYKEFRTIQEKDSSLLKIIDRANMVSGEHTDDVPDVIVGQGNVKSKGKFPLFAVLGIPASIILLLLLI